MKKTVTNKEYKARATIKRLFELHGKDWSIDFDFGVADNQTPVLDKYRVLLLSRMNFEDDRYDDKFEMKDANGEFFRLWEFADALKICIWKSGRAKKYVGSWWIDTSSHFDHNVFGIVGIHPQNGNFIIRFPNSVTWSWREIDLMEAEPADAVRAFELWDATRIEQHRRAVEKYDAGERAPEVWMTHRES